MRNASLYSARRRSSFSGLFRGKLGAILGFEPLYLLTRIVFVAVFLVVFCFCDQAPLLGDFGITPALELSKSRLERGVVSLPSLHIPHTLLYTALSHRDTSAFPRKCAVLYSTHCLMSRHTVLLWCVRSLFCRIPIRRTRPKTSPFRISNDTLSTALSSLPPNLKYWQRFSTRSSTSFSLFSISVAVRRPNSPAPATAAALFPLKLFVAPLYFPAFIFSAVAALLCPAPFYSAFRLYA